MYIPRHNLPTHDIMTSKDAFHFALLCFVLLAIGLIGISLYQNSAGPPKPNHNAPTYLIEQISERGVTVRHWHTNRVGYSQSHFNFTYDSTQIFLPYQGYQITKR